MHRRKLITTGSVAALAILAAIGGCREATTGPTSVKPQDFASNLRLLSGNQQSGSVGAALPEVLSVKVVDAGGQPVAGATVLWQVRAGGGSINPPASTSSVSGIASVTWTLGTSLGDNKAVAILQGNYVLDSATFTATAKVGPANKFTVVSGNAQTGRVASALGQPLTVNVKDQFGYPVVGAKVTWAAANLSGTVVANADTTDATGNATATWTLGQAAIAQAATATVGSLSPITFTATATPDTSRAITISAGAGQSAAAGVSLDTQLQVTVADKYGNPISNEVVFFNDSLSSGSTVNPVQVTTNAAGKASTTWTLGNRLGAQVARARVASTLAKATFTATAYAQYAQVYAGNYFSCGVTTGDKTFCWGFGEDGQRGIPAAKTANAPGAGVTTVDTLAGPFPTWRQIGAGSSFVCGISIARQLYCWGRLASVTQSNVPALKVFSSALTFQSVSTSEVHTCALSTDGRALCFGGNARGQLGDGTRVDKTSAYVQVGTTDTLFSAIVTGGSHTCGFYRYNPADSANTKRPRCWGANGSGQLGLGTITTDTMAILPVVMPSTSIRFDTTSLVAGNAHTCALTTAGAAYCWGANNYGQLGGASTLVRDSLPMLVAGGYTFTKLYAGEYHTCGITAAGTAYCWGRNNSGQLGIGNTTDTNTPVAVSGGLTFRSLALGELHSCGVANPAGASSGTQAGAGVLYCWGDNEYGQLGTGTTGTNGAPTTAPTVRVSGQP